MIYLLKNLIFLELLIGAGLLLFRACLTHEMRNIVGTKPAVLSLMLPAVALFGRSVWVFYAFLFCAAAFTSRDRRELAATYLLLLPAMPLLGTALVLGGVYLLPTTSFMALNLGAVVGLMLTPRRSPPIALSLDAMAALLVMLFVFIDARELIGFTPLRALAQNAATLLPPYLIASRCLRDLGEVRRALLSLCLAATIGSVTAIFGMVRHWDLYASFYPSLGVGSGGLSSTLSIRGGLMRMGGPMADYTAFGLFLAVVIAVLPLIRDGFRRDRTPLVVGVLLVGIFSTQSRGAWLGLIAGYCAAMLLRGRGGRSVLFLGGLGIAYALLGTVLGSSSRLGEMLGRSGSSTGTADYRARLLDRGLDEVAKHPILGQPIPRVIDNMPDLIQGQHIVDFVNTHLYVALGAGLVGLAVWFAIWAVPFARATRLRRVMPDVERRSGLGVAPAVMIAAAMTALTFTSTIDRNLFWPTLGLGFAAVLRPAPRRGRAAPAPVAAADALA